MLAAAWAVNHYREDVYGRRFKIVSDHSSLQQIIKKDIRDATTWLQRLLLRCQGFDFTIENKKGVEMPLKVCAATSAQSRTSTPRDQPNWDIWGHYSKWIGHSEDPISSKERPSLPGAREPMPARMARTLQSSALVGRSLLGLQTWHCNHWWNYCEEPKDRGAAEDERVFTPEVAPSPPGNWQINPESQGQVVLAWHDWTDQEANPHLPILPGAPT